MAGNPVSSVADAVAAFRAGDLDKARALAEAQLEAGSAPPQLLHLIGLIDCRVGRLDSGIEWLRRASDAEPGNTGFRVMLSRALVDAKRPREALAVTAPPSGTSPIELALAYARAEAAHAAGDHDASADVWGRIAAAAPRDWRARANQGSALAALNKWEESADAFRTAVAINPSEQSLRRSFSAALTHAGRNEEALAEIDVLVRQAPTSAELRFERAQGLDDLGRTAEALGEFEQAARLIVDSAGRDGAGLIDFATRDGAIDTAVLRKLAVLFERTSRMDSLAALVGQAKGNGIILAYPAAMVALREGKASEAKQLLLQEEPDDDPVGWHRLMSKIGEALRDPALAFREADAMNRSVGGFDEWRKRGAAYRQHIRDLAGTFTAEWMASVPRVQEAGSRRSPTFLVGFPRSGTTLLDTFLMGHPEVLVLEELPMLAAAQKSFGAMLDLPRLSQAQLQAARQAYFDELDRHVPAGSRSQVIDKLPLNMLGLPLIHSMFPDARVIFAQRHPADAVLSGFMQSFVLNDSMASFLDIHDAADFYDAALSAFSRARDLLPLNVQTSVYEQLIEQPEQALRPLLEFLGLGWREELLDHQRAARERGAIVTPSYDQVTQPLSKAPSGRWRRYREQLEPVLPVLLPWAERLGYTD